MEGAPRRNADGKWTLAVRVLVAHVPSRNGVTVIGCWKAALRSEGNCSSSRKNEPYLTSTAYFFVVLHCIGDAPSRGSRGGCTLPRPRQPIPDPPPSIAPRPPLSTPPIQFWLAGSPLSWRPAVWRSRCCSCPPLPGSRVAPCSRGAAASPEQTWPAHGCSDGLCWGLLLAPAFYLYRSRGWACITCLVPPAAAARRGGVADGERRRRRRARPGTRHPHPSLQFFFPRGHRWLWWRPLPYRHPWPRPCRRGRPA